MGLQRTSRAWCLLMLLSAQAAFANPVTQWLTGVVGPKCDGMCKPAVSAAVVGVASRSCPDGFSLEQDKLGMYQCVQRTLQPCPKGTALKDGNCCPPDSICIPTAAGLCPSGMVPKAFCPTAAKAQSAAAAASVSSPSTQAATSGGATRHLKSLLDALFAPAVDINAERVQPVVVLPKPLVSFAVPDSINVNTDIPLSIQRPKIPIVKLPEPVLSFIQPQNIDITLPSFSLPKPDITIPVLPAPKVSFLQPDALNTVGGSLNVQRKVAVIDASRLGPEKTYEVNLPSTPIDAMPPVKVEVKTPGQTIIDLSRYGPKDATVVQLPDIKVNLSNTVKVLHDAPKVNVINLGGLQPGPVYEIKLPDLPQKNKVTINLPKVNVSNVVLPGHAEKENVIVNLKAPDVAPSHTIKVTVDASNASALNLVSSKLKLGGGWDDINMNLVTLPPIKVDAPGPIVTLDLRKNKTLPRVEASMPDLDVVQITLPTPPKMGRDVNITLPGKINLNKFLPATAPGDDGGLNTTVTVVDAKLPSLNVISALSKPLIRPGNFSVSKGKWGVSVAVEDVMTGGRGNVSAVALGKPLANDSAVRVLKGAVASALAKGEFCKTKCCPACKPQPVVIEYAPVASACAPGCASGGAGGAQCVCKPAAVAPCPAGKRACQPAGGAAQLCVDAAAGDKACKLRGAVCLAKAGLVPACQ